jgi:hypothetical protein
MLVLTFRIPLSVRLKPDAQWCVAERKLILAITAISSVATFPARTQHNDILSDLKIWIFDKIVALFLKVIICVLVAVV